MQLATSRMSGCKLPRASTISVVFCQQCVATTCRRRVAGGPLLQVEPSRDIHRSHADGDRFAEIAVLDVLDANFSLLLLLGKIDILSICGASCKQAAAERSFVLALGRKPSLCSATVVTKSVLVVGPPTQHPHRDVSLQLINVILR
jgi:hypothetical protein